MLKPYDVLIIGSGPCGVAAALKLKERGVHFAIVEKSMPGGKVSIAPRVDNYPGYKEIPGPELAMEFYKKLLTNNIEIISDNVISLTKEGEIFSLKGENAKYFAKTVLIASGTTEKKLGLEKEDELLGRGLSYCAICDGHFYRKKDVVVVGGFDHTIKEAIYLSNICNKVTVIHEEKEFSSELNELLKELKKHENVEFIMNTKVIKINATERINSLTIKDNDTGNERDIETVGFFPLVGLIPNTSFIKIDNVLNENGFIPFNKEAKTNVEGLFAGGDVLERDTRLIPLAEKDGVNACKSIMEYLNK